MNSNPLTSQTPQMPQQQANASSDSTSAVTGNRVAVRLHTPASAAIPQGYMQPAVGSTMAAAEKRQSNPLASPAVPGSNAGQHTMLLPLDRCQCGEAAGSVHSCDGCGRNMANLPGANGVLIKWACQLMFEFDTQDPIRQL